MCLLYGLCCGTNLRKSFREPVYLFNRFTVPQIEQAAKKVGISLQYIPYAIALYRHEESNRSIKLYRIDQQFLEILRTEIAKWFFDGYEYRTRDVLKLAKPRAWRGGIFKTWQIDMERLQLISNKGSETYMKKI
ncbi:MAG: DUF6559 family protein [Candidatus Thiodiazotropha endolucinida]